MNLIVVVSGALVFASAEIEGFSLFRAFFGNQASLSLFIAASFLWVPFWTVLGRPQRTVLLRVLAALIVSAVVLGWFAVRYPVALQTLNRGGLTFSAAAAPEPTLKALLGALLVGSALIFPALFYLFKVFKWETIEGSRVR
jgi:cytochrome d ubiquinol oxidase subunit II